MPAKHIWFVRHGESLANAGGITSVAARVPLTDRGREQARAVSKALPVKPSLIISSPYDRARETAEPTIQQWPDVKMLEWPVQEYTYLSWNKMGPTTAAQRELAALPYWEKMDPDYADGPDAESYNAMMARVDNAIDLIKDLNVTNAVIFSHKLFLSTLFYRLVNQHPAPPSMSEVRTFMKEYQILNGAIAHYIFEENGEAQMVEMLTDHLTGKASAMENTGT